MSQTRKMSSHERREVRLLVATLGVALGAWGLACGDDPAGPGATVSGDAGVESGADAGRADEVSLVAVVDLPRTTATQTLSATWFDAERRTLFALQDRRANIVPFEVADDFSTFTPKVPIPLTGRPDDAWDGEGLVGTTDGFVAVTHETRPIVERFDRSGKFVAALTMPDHFAAQAAGNKGLESLSISPSGTYLFTANESALTTDGPAASKSAGTFVRILRRDLASGKDEERAYRTEPLGEGTGGDMGVSDVAALSDDVLLVLERGYQPGYGNTVRLFRIDFTKGDDVLAVPSLDGESPATKTLVADLGTLPSDGVTHPATQPNPILDNYEALAVAGTLPDGRVRIVITSDDNAQNSQVSRVLVLAIPPP